MQNAALHVVLASLVATRRPALLVRHREHRRVLARAIVVEPRRAVARFADNPGTSLRGRIVGTTGEMAFLEADVLQHPLDYRDVLRLTAVRRARDRELFFAPFERVEASGTEEGD